MGKFAFYPGVWDGKQKVDGTEPAISMKSRDLTATTVSIPARPNGKKPKKLYERRGAAGRHWMSHQRNLVWLAGRYEVWIG